MLFTREQWRSKPVRISLSATLAICAIALVALWFRATTSFEVQLVDSQGDPLAGIPVEVRKNPTGNRFKRENLRSDNHGKVRFRLLRVGFAEIEIPPSRTVARMKVSFNYQSAAAPYWNVQQAWRQNVGEGGLDQAFTNHFPATQSNALTCVLSNDELERSPARRAQIAASITRFRKEMPNGIGYDAWCRNVDGVDFIPELIAIYRSDEKTRGRIINGLTASAAILAQLESAWHEMEKKSTRADSTLDAQLAPWFDWAELPLKSRVDRAEAMQMVHRTIDARIQSLVDFVEAEPSWDPQMPKPKRALEWFLPRAEPGR